MKKCQMLGVLLTGLLSKVVLGAPVPPGYPADAEYKTPDSATKKFYYCNNSYGDNGKWPLDVCWEKFSASSDKVYTWKDSDDRYASGTNYRWVNNTSTRLDFTLTYTRTTCAINASTKQRQCHDYVTEEKNGRAQMPYDDTTYTCPPKLFPLFKDEWDIDGDGKPDRCYNPADKLKERVKVLDNICWKKGAPTVSTPSTSDEDRIKAAAKSALDALNSLDRDMKNPDGATDKTKLDAIAQSFSLNGYQDPDFHILASLISTEAGCMRPKLEGIITDPQGHNIRINDYEGGFYGVNCKMPVGSEVIDFTELSKKLFTGYTSELSPTISHEVHHRCNGRDDLTDNGLGLTTAQIESERIDFLNTSVSRFKSSISRGDGESAKKYWARVFITNAYVFEDIMKVYR